jgi:hypothetical protein
MIVLRQRYNEIDDYEKFKTTIKIFFAAVTLLIEESGCFLFSAEKNIKKTKINENND